MQVLENAENPPSEAPVEAPPVEGDQPAEEGAEGEAKGDAEGQENPPLDEPPPVVTDARDPSRLVAWIRGQMVALAPTEARLKELNVASPADWVHSAWDSAIFDRTIVSFLEAEAGFDRRIFAYRTDDQLTVAHAVPKSWDAVMYFVR